MQDIEFYMKSFDLKRKILKGEKIEGDVSEIYESFKLKKPTVFQVETTNVCNLHCVMCPRTRLMKRKVGHMTLGLYQKVIDQIEPFSTMQRLKWQHFLNQALSKSVLLRSDEDFFNFVISTDVLTLHGYGEPPLDPHIVDRIKIASEKNIPTYFSCNPMNMRDELFKRLLDTGISYIKYSIDGLDNQTLQKYRGTKTNLQNIREQVERNIDMIKQGGYSTILILTMIQFGGNQEQNELFLKEWKDKGVFAYIKNSHGRWLYEEDNTPENTSHYMRFYCEYPWMSMSILYDGTVVPCPLDFDGIMTMGNIEEQPLEEIWNSEKYREFREMHAKRTLPVSHFCRTQCDMPIIGDVVKEKMQAGKRL